MCVYIYIYIYIYNLPPKASTLPAAAVLALRPTLVCVCDASAMTRREWSHLSVTMTTIIYIYIYIYILLAFFSLNYFWDQLFSFILFWWCSMVHNVSQRFILIPGSVTEKQLPSALRARLMYIAHLDLWPGLNKRRDDTRQTSQIDTYDTQHFALDQATRLYLSFRSAKWGPPLRLADEGSCARWNIQGGDPTGL